MILDDFNSFGTQMNPMMRLGQGLRIQVESFQIIPMQQYHQQFMRPYTTTMTGNIDNKLKNLMGDFNNHLPASAIAATVNDFILPTAAPEFKYVNSQNGMTKQNMGIEIENGWQEKRFTFILLVSVTSNNMVTRELVTGYTDRIDGVYRDAMQTDFMLDPNTTFYINSVSNIDTRSIGGIAMPIMTDSFSVMGGGMGSGHYDNNSPWKMTPMTLLNEHSNIQNNLTTIPMQTNPNGSDCRAVSGVPTLAHRFNNSPTHYFGEIVNRYRNAAIAANNVGTGDSSNILDEIRGSLCDPSVSSVGFMAWLSGYKGLTVSTFSYHDLEQAIPNLDAILKIQETTMRTTNQSAYWGSSDRETQMALVIANMVTNLCLRMSITFLSFKSTNNVIGSQAFVQLFDMRGISPQQTANQIHTIMPQIEQTIRDELIPVVSSNGQLGYDIMVNYNSNSEIEIHIGYNGQEPYIYAFPAFCDALLSPILTTDSKLLQRNSRDIGSVINEVEDQVRMRSMSNGSLNYQTPSDFMGGVNQQMAFNPAPQMQQPVMQPNQVQQTNDVGFSTGKNFNGFLD